ncbi:hypothetical protein AX15_003145 [Amanita polypyramis BW_CC]|nr:hypothetical protein AX15_003145 [Amanita polypyramis BW_CC]
MSCFKKIGPSSVSSDITSPPPGNTQRALVLCFDGTSNKFENESNVARFYKALRKDCRDKQIGYYQPGIGTHEDRSFIITHTMRTLQSAFDSALALYLEDHVKDGYQFIVQNYRPGDKIYLFGFSRGAYTARVVAGMLYMVGVLRKEYIQLLDAAFDAYCSSHKVCQQFKKSISASVDIEFVGVWDTVSSVGITSERLPYTSTNYAIKTFRHALALDEWRTKFYPRMWGELTPDREQPRDIDFPEELTNANRNNWKYIPPTRDHTDVKEVWFAGDHGDVGGGSHRPPQKQNIALHWMIRECILAKNGILFDREYLKTLDFDFEDSLGEKKNANVDEGSHRVGEQDMKKLVADFREDVLRVSLEIIFVLLARWFWWMLEASIPEVSTFQDSRGNWVRRRMLNLGRGRYIPFYEDKIFVHKSVRELTSHGYIPKVSNWEVVIKSPMFKYVD